MFRKLEGTQTSAHQPTKQACPFPEKPHTQNPTQQETMIFNHSFICLPTHPTSLQKSVTRNHKGHPMTLDSSKPLPEDMHVVGTPTQPQPTNHRRVKGTCKTHKLWRLTNRSSNLKSSPACCQILSMILIICRVSMSCRRSATQWMSHNKRNQCNISDDVREACPPCKSPNVICFARLING